MNINVEIREAQKIECHDSYITIDHLKKVYKPIFNGGNAIYTTEGFLEFSSQSNIEVITPKKWVVNFTFTLNCLEVETYQPSPPTETINYILEIELLENGRIFVFDTRTKTLIFKDGESFKIKTLAGMTDEGKNRIITEFASNKLRQYSYNQYYQRYRLIGSK